MPSWAQRAGGDWAWPRGKILGEGRSARFVKGWRPIPERCGIERKSEGEGRRKTVRFPGERERFWESL